ncbi:hypothetical protein G4V62_08960 [Bacillaceae bacterium SIJ1]|uniref:cadherin-like beta sandwich domain-containing protein n=1 Tax=Litoribacterium kuwaitense TaxID=1398745 RepID=UPI0013ECEA8F|nr:cadherin-like beta sandwich domain-containing protein [Litoribacterium kuwaitense]NGP45080.1 hypothetical protein [Litoribacterium kuwaitense]
MNRKKGRGRRLMYRVLVCILVISGFGIVGEQPNAYAEDRPTIFFEEGTKVSEEAIGSIPAVSIGKDKDGVHVFGQEIHVVDRDPYKTETQLKLLRDVGEEKSDQSPSAREEQSFYGTEFVDLNEDGYLDLVTAGPNGGNYVYQWNPTDSRLDRVGSTFELNNSSFYGKGIVSGDFTNDGKPDVLWFTNSGVLLGVNGSTEDQVKFSSIQNTSIDNKSNIGNNSVDVGDFNEDGHLDFIANYAPYPDEGHYYTVGLGNGDGTFEQERIPHDGSSFRALYVSVGDFNQDGYDDFVLVRNDNGQSESEVILFTRNSANDGFDRKTLRKDSLIYRGIQVGDVNNDGLLDIVLLSQKIDIYLNQGAETFNETPDQSLETFSHWPTQLMLYDINSDGKLDILTLENQSLYQYLQGELHEDALPTASPSLTGTARVGEKLTATSGYQDEDGDEESGTTYAFFSYDHEGENETEVQPASPKNTYTIKASDIGKVILVKVVPKNENGTGEEAASATTEVIPSNNAFLSDVTLSQGELNEDFASEKTNYTASVANEVTEISVTPTVADDKAEVTVDDQDVESGQSSGDIELDVGTNTIEVVVSAEDDTTKTYTIDVFRQGKVSVSAGHVTGKIGDTVEIPVKLDASTSGIQAYTIELDYDPNALTLIEVKDQSGATSFDVNEHVINGQFDESLTELGELFTVDFEIAEGEGDLPIDFASSELIDENDEELEATFNAGKVTVLSENANLRALDLSAGMLTPDFSPDTTDYSLEVEYDVSQLTVTPTVDQGMATVDINGTTVENGFPSSAIELEEGENTVAITVTAEDGTEKEYTITVTRAEKERTGGGSRYEGPKEEKEEPKDREEIQEENEDEKNEVPLIKPITPVQNVVVVNPKVIVSSENADEGAVVTLDSEALLEQLTDSEEARAFVIPVELKDNRAKVLLTVRDIGTALAHNEDHVFIIKAGDVEYSVRADALNVADLAQQLGVSEEAALDAQVEVHIEESWAFAGQDWKTTLATPVFEFTAAISTGEQTFNVEPFSSSYTDRAFAVDPLLSGHQAVGVIVHDDGTISPVPTVFANVDGENIAILKHRGDGSYAVIRHEVAFTDMDGHWAEDTAHLLGNKLIVKGYKDGSFKPENTITRGEFTTIVARSLGLGMESSDAQTFSDVEKDDWYRGALQALIEERILQGDRQGLFQADEEITRDEAAVILANVIDFISMEMPEEGQTERSFTDVNHLTDATQQAINTLSSLDIVHGYEDFTFKPEATMTRAEAVQMIVQLLEQARFITK